MKKTLIGWLRLMRVPNLFSVPGDPAAGFLLTLGAWVPGCGWRLFPLMAASLCAYIAGLISNDLADLKEDCEKRPFRPIPSQTVSIRAAVAACIAASLLTLVFAAVGMASFLVAVALLICIFRYNFCKNESGERGTPGLIRMAMCRFLSILLGAAGVYDMNHNIDLFRYAIPLTFAVGVFLYIYGLSRSAQSETELLPERPGYRIFLSGAIISYGTLFALVIQKPTDNWYELTCGGVSAISAAVFLVLAYWCFRLFHYPILPRQVQSSIGLLIFGLIFLQAAAMAAASALWIAFAFLAAAAVSRFAAKAFYGS